MMDSNALLQNDDFEKLPETYVIFITSKDYLEKGLPLYTINRHIEELEMMPFDDEEHIIYVNGEYINDTPIGKLMHDFKCTEPNEMIYPNLAERASYLKNTKGGYEDMCQIMEESNKEYAKQKAYQAAMKLIRKGILSKEDIADALELTIKDVEALTKMVKANA